MKNINRIQKENIFSKALWNLRNSPFKLLNSSLDECIAHYNGFVLTVKSEIVENEYGFKYTKTIPVFVVNKSFHEKYILEDGLSKYYDENYYRVIYVWG